jgi:hypothetical protein
VRGCAVRSDVRAAEVQVAPADLDDLLARIDRHQQQTAAPPSRKDA